MLAGGDITDLVDRFDAKSLHVRAPSPIILLCGGPIDVGTLKLSSLREAYTWVYNRPILKDYATVIPEEFKIFAPDGSYKDWLSFECEFAQIVDLIVLFSESYGSVAELGAFAMVEEIARRLLVIIDDKNYKKSSFVKFGPVLRLEEKYGKSAVCVLNRCDINIPDITDVANVNLDSFSSTLISAITKRRNDYRESTTFIPNRAGHLIKLIVGLIQHYGALTETETEVFLFAMELDVTPEKILDYLLCAVSANWILRDKRGVEVYYCALPNKKMAVEYKLREGLSVDEKDKERWRVRVIEYWRTMEPDRFSSIKDAQKGAL